MTPATSKDTWGPNNSSVRNSSSPVLRRVRRNVAPPGKASLSHQDLRTLGARTRQRVQKSTRAFSEDKGPMNESASMGSPGRTLEKAVFKRALSSSAIPGVAMTRDVAVPLARQQCSNRISLVAWSISASSRTTAGFFPLTQGRFLGGSRMSLLEYADRLHSFP